MSKKLKPENIEVTETLTLSKNGVKEEPVIPEEKKEEPVIEDKKEEPVIPEEKKEEPVIEKSEEEKLEDAIKEFQNNNSEHEVQEEKKEEPKNEISNSISGDNLSTADEFKVQMFLNLFFLLLDGVHSFIYGFFYKKYKISKGDIELDEDDKEGIEGYFKTKRVIDLINKLPTELIGFIHIEYLYWQKFADFKEAKELEEKQKLIAEKEKEEDPDEDPDEEEDEDEEKTETTKPVKKRKYRKTGKYSKKKKKPVKKVKEEKKDE